LGKIRKPTIESTGKGFEHSLFTSKVESKTRTAHTQSDTYSIYILLGGLRGLLRSLLGEQHLFDVGDQAAIRDGDAGEQLISSSSPLTARSRCLGMMRLFLFSLAVFPASSITSVARYSRIEAR
jgi:hypothetical protein